METSRRDPFPGSFRMLFEVGTVAGMTDGQLLDRFLDRRAIGAEAAEIAFGALVERHGPMVLRVCRGRLGDEHDAQDAFQATFLILARKAGSIRNRDSAASWLQGVARRVAACARRASAIRRAKERSASKPDSQSSPDSGPDELVPAVREEVGDLPEKYRTPLMLCLLDGLTHEEAATRLGWPVGTVKTRVRQAKDRLRTRLTRRGFAPSIGVIAAALTVREASAMPLSLVRSTARAAVRFAAGKSMTAGAASASVATLVQMGIGSLLMSRIKILGLIVTSLGAIGVGASGYARQGQGGQEKAEPVVVKAEVKPAVEAPKPVAAEVNDQDLLAQVDLARIDLERLQYKAGGFKNGIMLLLQQIEPFEGRIEQAKAAKTIEELNQLGLAEGVDDLEVGRKSVIDENMKQIQQKKERLERARANYIAINQQYRHEERRIKEMEERAAHALVPSEPKPPTDGERIGDPRRQEQIDALELDVELLGREVSQLKQDVTQGDQTRLMEQSHQRNLDGPNPMTGGMPSSPLSGADLENEKKQTRLRLEAIELDLKSNRENYLVKNRELKDKQRRLKELQGQTGQARLAAEPKPPVETERTIDTDRLERVEKTKLDVEFLTSQVNGLKEELTNIQDFRLQSLSALRALNPTSGQGTIARIRSGPNGKPLTGEELEGARKLYQDQLDALDASLKTTQAEYLARKRELAQLERELAGLQEKPAASPGAEAKAPPADVERRLSDVERKLDQILKALEARPAGK